METVKSELEATGSYSRSTLISGMYHPKNDTPNPEGKPAQRTTLVGETLGQGPAL